LKTSITIELSDFEDFFKSNYGELCGYANKYLQDVDEAEEVVQNTFVKFWENRKTINIKSSFKSYIYTTIKNNCLNVIKHQKVKNTYKQHNEQQLKQQQFGVDDEYEATELEQKIQQSIQQLPDGRQQVFIMSRYEGLKYKEIADKLKISIKTVENQMGSTIKFLKSELADYLVTLALIFNVLMK